MVVDEADDVREGWKVTQLEIRLAGDIVGLAHRGKDFGLLDGVDAEVGFEVEIEVKHVDGITSLFGDEAQDAVLDRVGNGTRRHR